MTKTNWWVGKYDHEPDYEEIFEKNGQPIPKKQRLGAKKYPAKTDCFGFTRKEGEPNCTILKRAYCQYETCGFYKTWRDT